MKKRWTKGIAALALTGALMGTAGAGLVTAFADVQDQGIVADDFQSTEAVGSYDNKAWTAYADEGAPFKVEALSEATNMFRLGGTEAKETAQGMVSERAFTDLKEISFDMFYGSTGWMSFWFTAEAPAVTGDLVGTYKNTFGASNFLNGNKWVSVRIKIYSSTYAKMFVVPRGEAWPDEESPTREFDYTSKVQNNEQESNGQGFNDNNPGFDMKNNYFSMYFNTSEGKDRYFLFDNFKFVEGDENTVTTEDFEGGLDNTETKMRTLLKNGSVADQAVVSVAGVNKLAINGAKKGDRFISNKEIAKNDTYLTDDAKIVNTSFEATFANDTDKIGYVFGMSAKDGDPFKNTYVFEMSATGAEIARYNGEGEKESLTNATVAYSSIAGTATSVSITVNKGGQLSASVGATPFTFDGIGVWDGYTGLVAVEDTTGKTYIDDLAISSKYYKVPVSKSVTTNFTTDYNVKDSKDTTGADFAYNPSGGTITVNDGEMNWTHLSDDMYFGSVYEYDEFICDFKLTSILYNPADMTGASSTPCNKWIGFAFGKRALSAAYGSNAMFLIRITQSSAADNNVPDETWDTASVGIYKSSANSTSPNATGSKVASLPAQLFKDISYDGVTTTRNDIAAEDAVCFRFVASAKENKVDMYAKKASDGAYVHYYTIENVKVSGYASLACTGYTFLSIDDYSMVNTAEIYSLPDTYVPEADESNKEEVVTYDRGHVDVNWEEELDLNAAQTTEEGGCNSSISAGAGIGVATLLGCAVTVFKKKKD